jgi:DNA polymerase-3 subunit alpha (Gram-positive type)
MMAWRIAYCKIHRPQAYYSAFFSIRAKAFSYELMCMGKAKIDRTLADFRKRKDDADNKNEDVKKLSTKEEGQLADLRVVEEMYARGYEFAPIDIFKVKARLFQVLDDGRVMPSLTSIEGLGETVADSIVEAAKQGPFLSKDDFRERSHASGTITDDLVRLGILTGLPESNQISLFDFM